MPIVKVADIAYGRLQSPSLDEAEEFLVNFGMVRAARTKDALYMRGTDPNHHLHVTHLGAPKFGGLAFFAENEDELKKLAKAPGASGIENIDEPGGGKRGERNGDKAAGLHDANPPSRRAHVIPASRELRLSVSDASKARWRSGSTAPRAAISAVAERGELDGNSRRAGRAGGG